MHEVQCKTVNRLRIHSFDRPLMTSLPVERTPPTTQCDLENQFVYRLRSSHGPSPTDTLLVSTSRVTRRFYISEMSSDTDSLVDSAESKAQSSANAKATKDYRFFRSFSVKVDNWPLRKAEQLWRRLRDHKLAGLSPGEFWMLIVLHKPSTSY